jgi:hypothetical protein
MITIEESYDWFDENRDTIITGHHGECVAIRGKEVSGYFPDEKTALNAMENYTEGTFIVQDCLSSEEDTVHYYTGAFSFQ